MLPTRLREMGSPVVAEVGEMEVTVAKLPLIMQSVRAFRIYGSDQHPIFTVPATSEVNVTFNP